jgi:transposase
MRERLVRNRTSLSNEIRGFLGEYGIIIAQGISHVKNKLPLYFEDSKLTMRGQAIFKDLYAELVDINQRIDQCDQRIQGIYMEHKKVCDAMMQVEGIGLLCATALLTILSQPEVFENGRHFSAYLGLVPRQVSTGGKTMLRGITKSGNGYIRKLLIHGARSAVFWSQRKENHRSKWIKNKLDTRGPNKTCVALANKNARVIYALVKNQTQYQKAA